ncbi:MAG: hypothetical protein ABJA02_02910 [Acidobacteriota bacterium]
MRAVTIRREPISRSFKIFCLFALVFSFLIISGSGQTPPKTTLGKVNGSPGCGKSAICFDTPRDGLAREESRSELFYAIILKTTKTCGVSEQERQEIQAEFPHDKVFATQFECGGDDNAVTYENIDREHGFVAVYAGRRKVDALKRLKLIKKKKQFAEANLRRIQAIQVGS